MMRQYRQRRIRWSQQGAHVVIGTNEYARPLLSLKLRRLKVGHPGPVLRELLRKPGTLHGIMDLTNSPSSSIFTHAKEGRRRHSSMAESSHMTWQPDPSHSDVSFGDLVLL